jgi:hypothetical protein
VVFCFSGPGGTDCLLRTETADCEQHACVCRIFWFLSIGWIGGAGTKGGLDVIAKVVTSLAE